MPLLLGRFGAEGGVWAGQSNTGGGGSLGDNGISLLPAHLVSFTQADIWTMRGWEQISPGVNTTPFIYDGTFMGSPLQSWGSELEFAYQFWTRYGRRFKVIKYYESGTPLYSGGAGHNWDPNTVGANSLFAATETQVAAAIAASPLPLRITNRNFIQGETDATDSTASGLYSTNLPNVITSGDSRWGGDATTKWTIMRILSTTGSFSTGVRSAQNGISNSRITTINIDGFGIQGDAVHLDQDGLVSLGQAQFTAVYG